MQYLKILPLIIYLALSVFHLCFYMHQSLGWLTMNRGILMPLLALSVYLETNAKPGHTIWIILALLAGCAGDVLIVQHTEYAFLSGLSAFLIGHFAYITGFLREVHQSGKQGFIQRHPAAVPVYLLVTSGVMLFFAPYTGIMKVPVFIYIFVLLSMSMAALHRIGTKPAWSDVAIWLGSISFVVSDFMIAWDKFIRPLPYAYTFIMFTYLAGQYAIARGFSTGCRQKNSFLPG